MLEALRTKCGGSRITGLDWRKGLVLGLVPASSFLSFSHAYGCHPNNLHPYSQLVADLGHSIHVLVRVRSLFRHDLHARRPNDDSTALQGLLQVAPPPFPFRGGPAHETSSPMGCGSKAQLHRLRSANKDPATGAHAPRDQYWLAHVPVFRRNIRVPRRERPRGAFTMDHHLLHPSVNHVSFQLSNVVRHVIHDPHVHRISRPTKHF